MKKILYGIIGIISIVILFLWFRNIEPFTNSNPNSKMNACPTHLINDGDKLLLYNPTLAKVPGVNPIQFNNLEDYTTYVEWQRVNNLHCPILKLDKVDNAFDMYSIKSNESRNNFDIGNGNGTSVLNHDLPNIGLGCKDNGVKRITENDMLDYYTTHLKDLNQLPRKPYLQLNTPSSDSKLNPSTITEAFTTDLINSTDLTTI